MVLRDRKDPLDHHVFPPANAILGFLGGVSTTDLTKLWTSDLRQMLFARETVPHPIDRKNSLFF